MRPLPTTILERPQKLQAVQDETVSIAGLINQR